MNKENIQLSEGFFQEFFENNCNTNAKPLLQVLRSRIVDNNATVSLRVHLSDGIFGYTNCAMAVELIEKLKSDGLYKTANNFYPVIRLNNFAVAPNSTKKAIAIIDYELISLDATPIGEPTNHTGDPETFRGFMQSKKRKNDIVPADLPTKRPNKDNNGSGIGITPIGDLNPFFGKWKICGVVSSKEELREINSKRGPMKVFNFELTDANGRAIRIVAWAESAERYYQSIEKDATYNIVGTASNLRNANKRFNTTGHDYEINLAPDSIVEKSENAIGKPKFVLKPVSLDQIVGQTGRSIDVFAVIDKVEPCQAITSKDGRELQRRNVHLIDESGVIVHLTLWGDTAVEFDEKTMEHHVVGIKGAFVREFNGSYSLSISNGSKVEIDPDSENTQKLAKWYESSRSGIETKTVSTFQGSGNLLNETRGLVTLENSNILDDPMGIYFNVIGMISFIRNDSAIYTSCINDNCNKKVTKVDDNYRCEKCCTTNDKCNYRYMVTLEITDLTGSYYVTIFDDKAVALFGKTAAEMNDLLQENREEYTAIFQSQMFKRYQFRLRAKRETYNDVTRPRLTVFDIKTINYEKYSELLDILIKKIESV